MAHNLQKNVLKQKQKMDFIKKNHSLLGQNSPMLINIIVESLIKSIVCYFETGIGFMI